MNLQTLDVVIIFCYIGLTVLIGFYVSKKASANISSYFLGSKNLPWYMLGVSNASGMFDITHIMWLVSFFFAGRSR